MKNKKYEKTARTFYELDGYAQKLKLLAEERMIKEVSNLNFDRLLEIGCGDGHSLKKYNAAKVSGLEISKAMMQEASRDVRKQITHGDITNQFFAKKYQDEFDVVTANYVFTELKRAGITKALKNVHKMLKEGGRLYFTITNPKTRHLREFPGYKNSFKKKYEYYSKDLPFTVLLKSETGRFIDVGIRDFHNPLEIYDRLLDKTGFEFEREELKIPHLDVSFAVLYKCKKKSGSKGKIKIAIIGASQENKSKDLITLAKNLGKYLGKIKADVLTGASIGLPHLALLEAKKIGSQTVGYFPTKNEEENELYDDLADARDFSKKIFLKGFTNRSLNMIQESDAVLVLNGRIGTLCELTIAFEEHKPIFVFENSKGIAERIRYILKIGKKQRKIPVFYGKSVTDLKNSLLNYLNEN